MHWAWLFLGWAFVIYGALRLLWNFFIILILAVVNEAGGGNNLNDQGQLSMYQSGWRIVYCGFITWIGYQILVAITN